MQRLLKQGKLGFGCLDTWLIYKLSGGVVCVSEPSNASSTGLFDPYTVRYSLPRGFIACLHLIVLILIHFMFLVGLYHKIYLTKNLFIM